MSTQTYPVAVPNVMSSPTKEMSCIFLTLLQKAAGYCNTIGLLFTKPFCQKLLAFPALE